MKFQDRIYKIQFEIWLDCFIYNNRYILWLRRKHRKISVFVLLLTAPYLLINWIIRRIYEKLVGQWWISYLQRREQNKIFEHEVAIVAIAKNEGLYVREWVEFHRLVGVTKIYFYDNESLDNTRQLLQPYIDEGLIEYRFISGFGRQLDAYNDAINRYRLQCRYMAFIDLDEYLMPECPYEPISEIVERILSVRKGIAAGIALNWCLYGNSGHKIRPKGLITENYLNRAKETNSMNHMIKTLCNPRLVRTYISPHYPLYRLGAISVDSTGRYRSKGWFCRDLTFKNMRLNHYYCKSEEDYKIKKSRGLGDRLGNYNWEEYDRMNFNEVYDESMLVYQVALKEALD